MPQWVPLLLVAVALVWWPTSPVLLPAAAGADRPPVAPRPRPVLRAAVAGSGMAVAIILVWPTAVAPAVGAGLVAAAAVHRAGGRRSAPAAGARVAVTCDLWAAGLDSGLGTGAALAAALGAMQAGGPGGGPGSTGVDETMVRLIRVAGLLQVGADPVRAWEAAAGDPLLAPIAAAARRSQIAGADIAGTIREQATSVRRAESGLALRRADRAGVLMTAPLALCFLPAFICLGLAPVVIALVDTLDISR